MPQCSWVVRRRERFNANKALFQNFHSVVEFQSAEARNRTGTPGQEVDEAFDPTQGFGA
jgi:hypothetical protein